MTITEESVEAPARRPRIVASQLLNALGAIAAGSTLFLWWLGTVPDHPEHEVGREVLGNVPGAVEAAFYVGVSAFLFLSFHLFARRAEGWEQGAAEDRTGRWADRLSRLYAGLRMQTLMRDRQAGAMHSMVYFGFIVLFLGTVTLEIDHLMPGDLKFLHGRVYQGYSAVLDLAALVFLGGLAWAFTLRYLQRPWRIRSKTRPEDSVILGVLALIGVTGLTTEAARISLVGRPAFEVWSFVGHPLSALIPQSGAATFHQVSWVAHVMFFLAFLVVLPTTKLRHMVTSPANMALSARSRPKGAMRPMPNLLEADDIDSIGVSVVADLTWKQIFDTDACTICGRCTAVCPANITGKPLDPREMILKTGEVAASHAGVATPVSSVFTIEGDSLFSRVRPEEVWACTTCKACDEICPVDIEILDRILDMRRYLTLMESNFPSELGKAFMALENQGNPWGMSPQARGDWTTELDFEVPVLGENGKTTADYLWFVGCAGSFDDRNRAVSVSLARLLREAEIDFAILGSRETCNGDPARRAGNELVFQQLAMRNIESFADLGVKRIITQCPHCFNTLANEYPQLGGDYEVIHHSQLLVELLAQGRITPLPDRSGRPRKIAYHDPCYLGRHNDIYLAPRQATEAAGNVGLIEMPRHGTRALCCGAGGSRFWMEEHTGKKVNVERAEEAVATGAEEIAVACPYCYVMIDDGVKEIGKGDAVRVRDLAMILADGFGE